jgi:Ca2+/Na+ antiporter
MVAGAGAVIAGIAGSFAFLVFLPPPLTALRKPRLFSFLTMVTFPLIFTIEKWPNFVCIYYYSLFFPFLFFFFSPKNTLTCFWKLFFSLWGNYRACIFFSTL